MLEAILVRVHPPAGSSPAKVSAAAGSVRVSVAYDHNISDEENYTRAARSCAVRMGWHSATFVGGMLPSGDCAFVNADRHNLSTEARFDI